MKKALLFLYSLTVVSIASVAQLPNPSYENWNSIPYSEPVPWFTSNSQVIPFAGIAPVTQVAGFSGSAVRLETMVSGTDTLGAYISNTPGDPVLGEGGIPYAVQPIGITGYYRYNLQGNDTALLLVVFKSNGAIISNDLFKITGTQNTFTFFNFSLTVSNMPDTVIIAAASSNLISNVGVAPGSFLELDDLAFLGGAVTPPIPGGTFDNWNNMVYETPLGWTSLSNGTSKSTDSYSGNFALKLETIDYGNGNVGPGAVTTGINSGSGPAGGLPYTLMTDTLTGYYKYAPSGPDSAAIGISLSSNGSGVGGGGYYLIPATVYTYFEIPFSAFAIPDTLRIDIFSSKFPFLQTAAGSTLLVDDLRLKSQGGVGIETVEAGSGHAIVYPNPARDILYIECDKLIPGDVTVIVYDITGRKIRPEFSGTGSTRLQVNISALADGICGYEVINSELKISGHFLKQ